MMLKLSSTQFAFERGDAYVMYIGEPGEGSTTELPPHEQAGVFVFEFDEERQREVDASRARCNPPSN